MTWLARQLIRFIALASVVGTLASCTRTAQESQKTLTAEVAELTEARRILQVGEVPTAWDAGLFVSAAALQRMLDSLIGLEIDSDRASGVRLSLLGFEVRPEPGATKVKMQVQAVSSKLQSASATLEARGLLLYQATERAADGTQFARFRLSMLEVAPAARLGVLHVKATDFANEIISARLIELLGDSLHLRVPLGGTASLKLESQSSTTNSTGGERVPTHSTLVPFQGPI